MRPAASGSAAPHGPRRRGETTPRGARRPAPPLLHRDLPELSYSWCWYGRAAEALGLDGEALAAYRKAVGFEQRDDEETGAAELLDELEARLAREPGSHRR